MTGIPSEEEARLEGERAASAGSYKNMLGERDAALAEAYNTRGPGSSAWQTTKQKLIGADEKCRAIYAKLHRLSDGIKIPAIWILAAAILLAALEAPINKFMLDNILRGSNFDSYVFSLFVTLILLLLAHIAGKQARQVWGAYQEKFYFGKATTSVVIVLVLFFCVAALTIGRAAYSASGQTLPGNEIFAEITRQVQTEGVWGAFTKALSDQSAFFLLCMNTAAITGAFLVAYITHDSDQTYQSALDERDAADRRLARLESRYRRVVEKIGRKYRPTLGNIAAAYESQNARIIALKRARNCELSDDDRLSLSDSDKMLKASRMEIRTKAVTPFVPDDATVTPFPEGASSSSGEGRRAK